MDIKRQVVITFLTAIICVSFFLPWVHVESNLIGAISKAFSGKRQSHINSISAYKVPIMANGSDARLMISIIHIFNPDVKNADKKSWLIWAVPLFAVFICVMYAYHGRKWWVNLTIGIIGIVIFIHATYKIKSIDMDKTVVHITTAPGLWLTLWAYFGIGLFAMLMLGRDLLIKRKCQSLTPADSIQ